MRTNCSMFARTSSELSPHHDSAPVRTSPAWSFSNEGRSFNPSDVLRNTDYATRKARSSKHLHDLHPVNRGTTSWFGRRPFSGKDRHPPWQTHRLHHASEFVCMVWSCSLRRSATEMYPSNLDYLRMQGEVHSLIGSANFLPSAKSSSSVGHTIPPDLPYNCYQGLVYPSVLSFGCLLKRHSLPVLCELSP